MILMMNLLRVLRMKMKKNIQILKRMVNQIQAKVKPLMRTKEILRAPKMRVMKRQMARIRMKKEARMEHQMKILVMMEMKAVPPILMKILEKMKQQTKTMMMPNPLQRIRAMAIKMFRKMNKTIPDSRTLPMERAKAKRTLRSYFHQTRPPTRFAFIMRDFQRPIFKFSTKVGFL